jgi:hypothetical protein
MADAIRGGILVRGLPHHIDGGDDGLRHDRNSLYLSTGAQSAADDCATLVVPQLVPRLARQASMPGIHQFVI